MKIIWYEAVENEKRKCKINKKLSGPIMKASPPPPIKEKIIFKSGHKTPAKVLLFKRIKKFISYLSIKLKKRK